MLLEKSTLLTCACQEASINKYMPLSFEGTLLVFVVIWLLVLSFFSVRMILHYQRLTKGSQDRNLKSILEDLLTGIGKAQKDIDFLQQQCDRIEKEGDFHIQKIGLLRFNPFKDTGGDQSFILAFLNGRDTGVVISGLYSRSGTRWYTKQVFEGKGIEHDLSDEEKRVIKDAKHIKNE